MVFVAVLMISCWEVSIAVIECAVQKQIQYDWIKLCYIIKGTFTGVNRLRWLLLIVITDANVHRKLAREQTDKS